MHFIVYPEVTKIKKKVHLWKLIVEYCYFQNIYSYYSKCRYSSPFYWYILLPLKPLKLPELLL